MQRDGNWLKVTLVFLCRDLNPALFLPVQRSNLCTPLTLFPFREVVFTIKSHTDFASGRRKAMLTHVNPRFLLLGYLARIG